MVDKINKILENIISHGLILQIVIICIKVVLTYILLVSIVFLIRKLFKNVIVKREKQSIDNTNLVFIKDIIIYSVYCIGFLTMLAYIPGLDQLSKTLIAGAGILTAAIGFGSQQAISNIVSGIFMVIFKPFRVGDFIDLGGDNNKGTVIDITLRHTKIQNNENRIIVIPNSVINNQLLINSTIDNPVTCAFVQVNIDYRTDINSAMNILREEAMKHPFLIDNRSEADIANGVPQVVVRVVEWVNSSVTLRAWAWASSTGNAFVMRCDLLRAVKERFDKEGIDIPFQYSHVKMKS